MQKITVILTLIVFVSGSLLAQISTQDYKTLEWKVQKIHKGITWKYCIYDSLHPEPQSINVLQIDPQTAKADFGFIYLTDSRETTDRLAQSVDASVAVNGTFFNMAKGGSVCYLKVDDTIRNMSQPDLRSYIHEGAIAIDSNGAIHIINRPDSGWSIPNSYRDIMSSGPMLVDEGRVLSFASDPFDQNRHPRTGVGITSQGEILLVTVDGRNARASGMSIPEFAQLMTFLTCNQALNLDGGGSTTMYIKGITQNGIVNYPSDNKQFDHEGQRTVSNIVYFSIP